MEKAPNEAPSNCSDSDVAMVPLVRPIFVKAIGQKEPFPVDSDGCTTVLDFKERLTQHEKCTLKFKSQQKLFNKGKLLKDPDALADTVFNGGTDGKGRDGKVPTLMLVKGAAVASQEDQEAAAVAAAPSADKDGNAAGPDATSASSAPAAPVNCLGGCGFFGNKQFDGYCSQCYKKKKDKEEEESRKEEAERERNREKTPEESAAEERLKAREEYEKNKPKQLNKSRCFCEVPEGTQGAVLLDDEVANQQDGEPVRYRCNKKCGVAALPCRCGYVFCIAHRLPENHNCDFDYKDFGRDILRRANNKVEADGLED